MTVESSFVTTAFLILLHCFRKIRPLKGIVCFHSCRCANILSGLARPNHGGLLAASSQRGLSALVATPLAKILSEKRCG